jgi:lipoprotein-anchoring transpeptidase ErfK/SrfK
MQTQCKLGRRPFLLGGLSLGGLALTGCQTTRQTANFTATPQALSMYQALPGERFPIPAVDLRQVDPKFYRTQVNAPAGVRAGTIYVDTKQFYLYLVGDDERAIRYGVGLGRAGFDWAGKGRIAWKRKWPTWTPPTTMIARQPELEIYSAKNGGMKPGLSNPLGARALYIFEGNKDTLYRLHGTPEAASIGKAVSSGCVRLLHHDVIDLYNRVPNGTRIIVV